MFGLRDDHGRRIPSWDGRPDTWQEYKDEVRIWVLGSSNTAEYSLAARLVAHLRGPARRIGLSLTDEQLSPDITETTLGDGKVQRNVSHADSIKLLMDKLAALAPQQQDRRGQYLRDFFREEKYKRKAGERIAEWLPRWEEGVDRLRRDGVDFAVIDDLPGWFMLEHANLSESRLEMLRSHVPKDKIHDLAELRQSFLRLFPHIHVGERRFVAQRGQAQGRRRQVLMATEEDETTPEEDVLYEPWTAFREARYLACRALTQRLLYFKFKRDRWLGN